jgi:hypothetical protein
MTFEDGAKPKKTKKKSKRQRLEVAPDEAPGDCLETNREKF